VPEVSPRQDGTPLS
jgi:hypothetical protein